MASFGRCLITGGRNGTFRPDLTLALTYGKEWNVHSFTLLPEQKFITLLDFIFLKETCAGICQIPLALSVS